MAEYGTPGSGNGSSHERRNLSERIKYWRRVEVVDEHLTLDDAQLAEKRRLNRERIKAQQHLPMIDREASKLPADVGGRVRYGWHNGQIGIPRRRKP